MSPNSKDSFVLGDGLRLSVRDFGGEGSPILYIPGAGRSLVDAEVIVPYLVDDHRVLGMDLRGHGYSEDGSWTDFAPVLEDVRAVIKHFELTDVTILGHSLGGMIAAMLTATGEVSAGVNLDGHGQGRAELYDGYTKEQFDEVKAAFAELEQAATATPPVLAPEVLEQLRPAYLAQSVAKGFSEEQAQERVERMITIAEDGTGVIRPSQQTGRQLMGTLESLDLIELYRSAKAPLLVYNATADQALPPGAPDTLVPFMAAYRRGLDKALTTLAAQTAFVSYQKIDATHDLHLEQPALVAQQVKAFITAGQAKARS